MLRLACPHCGARDETEFVCGGESHITRPGPEVSDDMWADYLFARNNPRGVTFERWRHAYGCGVWFNIARNTASHEVKAVYAMGSPRPEAW